MLTSESAHPFFVWSFPGLLFPSWWPMWKKWGCSFLGVGFSFSNLAIFFFWAFFLTLLHDWQWSASPIFWHEKIYLKERANVQGKRCFLFSLWRGERNAEECMCKEFDLGRTKQKKSWWWWWGATMEGRLSNSFFLLNKTISLDSIFPRCLSRPHFVHWNAQKMIIR